MPAGQQDSLNIKAAHVTLNILEAVAFAGREVGVTELANQLGLTKATVFRHLNTLLDRGYVGKTAQSRYRLGIKSHLLGRLATASVDLLAASEQAMQELRDKTGETAVLSVVEPRVVRVVTTLMGKSQFEIGVRSGSELLFHASAQGKIALAFDPGLTAKMQKRHLTKLTDNTITSAAQLQRELETIRRRGWASAPEEVVLGLNAIAAPVFDEIGRCIACLAIVGSIQFVRRDADPKQIAAVQKAAARVSQSLGYTPGRLRAQT